MWVMGPDNHRAGVVIENVCLRRDLALTNDDAQGLTIGETAVRTTGGQRGVIDENRSGSDDDGLDRATMPVNVGTGGLAGDPLAAAVGSSAATVDTRRELPGDMW